MRVREVVCVDSYVHVKGLAKSKKFEKHTEDRKILGGTLEISRKNLYISGFSVLFFSSPPAPIAALRKSIKRVLVDNTPLRVPNISYPALSLIFNPPLIPENWKCLS